MAQIPLSLDRAHMADFRTHGLKLNGLGATTRLNDASWIEGPTAIQAKVAPGAYLGVGAFCNLSGGTLNNVDIGRYCSIAQGVVIGSHEHPIDWLTTSRAAYVPDVNGWDQMILGDAAHTLKSKKRPFPQSCPTTTLGPDVWIGQGAFIKAGVTIGAGAIIGARATVVKDVPPYAIVVGTPGRVLRMRFPDETVARLMALAWWQYAIYDLFDAPMDDIDTALDMIETMAANDVVTPYQGPVLTAADLATPDQAMSRLRSGPVALAS